jgi:hypothetical protein
VALSKRYPGWTCHVTPDDALDYIKKLAAQYLNPHMRQWLPFDAVIDAAGDLDKICDSKDFERFQEDFLTKLSAALAETEDSLVHLSCPEITRLLYKKLAAVLVFFLKT